MELQQSPSSEIFMQRAFQLALLGHGSVAPNPMVGCVIVADGKIIGEGWHRQFGQAHAEVNAVNAVADKSMLQRSTVYVTLEPCSHFGKTPPCADLLIRHKVKKVVISNVDSNPLVCGGGITKLKEAGIDVESGVLETVGRQINRRFFTFIEAKRPFIILKWAQTSDGYIARENFDSKWISSTLSRQLVHRWRSQEDSILVGRNTAQHDNPQLTVRSWTGRNPVRIVIDKTLSLAQHLSLFDGSVKTLLYTTQNASSSNNVELVKLDERNFIQQLLSDLHTRGIQSVLVEGGAQTLRAFIEQGVWDEARVFTSSEHFGGGIAAPQIDGVLQDERTVDTDVLRIYFKK